MLKVKHFCEDNMEDLVEAMEEFFDDIELGADDIVDVQYDFRHQEAMIMYEE